MTQTSSNEAPSFTWEGDLLDREAFSVFLTKYLINRTVNADKNEIIPFTMAIDGQWGQGKTYFVSNWEKTLCRDKYPTIYFDAWKADYASDPIITFMAEFKNALNRLLNESEINKCSRNRINDVIHKATLDLRRALLPAGKQILKSLINKATGIATDEIISAINDDKPHSDKNVDILKDGLDALNKGLDTFFDKALEEDSERKLAIKEFRISIETIVSEISKTDNFHLPMFVFIDELDRCRPNFAISLLEGIKHLFGIKGVCFVISTNLDQLAHSTKAIYGEGFDGRGYLKRFFDVEAALPVQSMYKYLSVTVGEFHEFKEANFSNGLPYGVSSIDGLDFNEIYSIHWVVESFSIDLRSQRTLVEMIVASISSIDKSNKIHILWLSFLCALKLKFPNIFSELLIKRNNADDCIKTIPLDFQSNSATEKEFNIIDEVERKIVTKKIKLFDVIKVYLGLAWMDLNEINNKHRFMKNISYPETIINDIVSEMPRTFNPREHHPTSLACYIDLVNNAGYLEKK